MINLNDCAQGDTLISSHGAILEYVAPTPWGYYTYLDHVVRFLFDRNGRSVEVESYGTRTSDGYVFSKKRIPETDHDIVHIIQEKDGGGGNRKLHKISIPEGKITEFVKLATMGHPSIEVLKKPQKNGTHWYLELEADDNDSGRILFFLYGITHY
jgi:hypothetical protein